MDQTQTGLVLSPEVRSLITYDPTDVKQIRPYVRIGGFEAAEGGENDNRLNIRLAKMKILNQGSPETRKSAGLEGAEEGVYWHTGEKKPYTDLNLVLLYITKERYYSKGNSNNVKDMICTSRDGRAQFGTCLDGNYEAHNIPKIQVNLDGVFGEVGECARCPHARRKMGERSKCQLAHLVVCTPYAFLAECEEILKGGDRSPETMKRILDNLFILTFKSSGMQQYEEIKRAVDFKGTWFAQVWNFKTFYEKENAYEWYRHLPEAGQELTEDEKTIARSLMKLAQEVKPTVSDVEIVDHNPAPGLVRVDGEPAGNTTITIE